MRHISQIACLDKQNKKSRLVKNMFGTMRNVSKCINTNENDEQIKNEFRYFCTTSSVNSFSSTHFVKIIVNIIFVSQNEFQLFEILLEMNIGMVEPSINERPLLVNHLLCACIVGFVGKNRWNFVLLTWKSACIRTKIISRTDSKTVKSRKRLIFSTGLKHALNKTNTL